MRMLLQLTTTGARSGVQRTVTVAYAEDAGRLLVFASNAGRPQAPAWLHNLRADPHVTVEVNGTRYDAIAEELTGSERDRLYAEQAERDPAFAAYQENTSRVIQVVALTPARVGAATAQLKEIHAGLREQLTTTLAAVDAYLAGDAPAPSRFQTLHQHCLSFCSSLHAHHSREDGVFPRLAANFPELKPALDRLAREHTAVAALNEQLTETLDQLIADPAQAQHLRATLTQLATDLETHYAYEEARLGPALDAA
ncbi:nitroreductase/quinone reductase family protein [Kribbella pratensis]|uniref:Deazaflavin-dependent oxidoreductase (Nitroreductase family) n=1 Tax=Kribbella pratensis TaxID=2512112 RepID=A0A4V3GFX6_9ACTN|nr:nitroreductase/quinone reductase family protein [Kribbella pratensis]TDW70007.1 deazaflavin-dependent oxidoreductase (nitroreductase family) [Kribbella pratensis]